MSQNPVLLDLEIAFYHAMSQAIQYKRNLKDKPAEIPQKILVREELIHAWNVRNRMA